MGARYQPLAAAYLLAFFAKAVSSTIRPGAKFRGVKIQSAFPVFSLAMMSLAAGLSSIYHSQSSSSVYVVFAVFFSGGAAWNFVDYGQPLEFWMHRIEQVTEDDHAMFFSNVSRAIQLIATEALGGCLGISVAQLVFAAQLSGASVGPYHNVYKSLVLSGRASSWTSRVEPDFVDDVKFFFDRTLTNTFYVAAAAGAGTFVVFLVAVVLSSFVPGRKLLEKWQKEQDIHRNLTNNSISATDNSFGEANLGDSAMRERNLNILTVRDRPRWALRTPFRYFLSPQQREIAEIEMQAVSRRRRRSSRTTESLDSEDDVRSEARAI